MAVSVLLILLCSLLYFAPAKSSLSGRDTEEFQIPNNLFPQNDVKKILSNAPIAFTENCGQLENDEVRFYAQGGGVWFTDEGVWFELREYTENNNHRLHSQAKNRIFKDKIISENPIHNKPTHPASSLPQDQGSEPGPQESQTHIPIHSHTSPLPHSQNSYNSRIPTTTHQYKSVILKQEFVGANLVRPVGRERCSWNSNFFYGNDSSKWCTNVPNYREIYYENLYDGIDLRYYSIDNGLKYDFIVHPGAAVEQIKIKYYGIEGLEIDHLGDLIVKTSIENLIDGDLFIYQNYEDSLHQVNGQFKIYNDFVYGFELLGEYDKSRILVIDPHLALKYSTFIGATGYDWGDGIAVDAEGNAFVSGFTNSLDFPNTTGAYDQTPNGSSDIFILKLASNGSTLIYSTYIGGTDYDGSWSIVIDSNGSAVITGDTGSADFPTTPGVFDRIFNATPNADDCIVLKLNQNGSALIFSTFIGGSLGEWGNDIDIDLNGNVYVGGHTNSLDFPNTTGAFDQSYPGIGGNGSGFLIKFNHNCSKLIYSTFIGGTGDDYITAIEVDPTGCVFAVGRTTSSDFPITPGAFHTVFSRGFVLKLNSTGSDLMYSTFVGGSSGLDSAGNIAIDVDGYTYIVGVAYSTDFPTTPGAYDTSHNGGIYDVFVAKLNQNGSALNYSTFIGGKNWDLSKGISIDADCNAIITGDTTSTDFPITSDAYQKNHRGGFYDAFIARLNANGSKLLYSTYFGGTSRDESYFSDFDSKNNVYMTGSTNSTDLPTTPAAFDRTFNGNIDGFVLKFSLPPIVKIKSVSLLKNNESTNITYTKLCPYTFKVKVIDNPDLAELRTLRLCLDPLGLNIQLIWNRATGIFSKVNDPNNFITLEPSSKASNNSVTKWTIDFNLTFDWTYPDEDFHDVHVFAITNTLTPVWYNVSKLFRVENDLEFIGNLSVYGEDNRTISENDFVRGGEKLNWTGLTPVYEGTTDIYPPNEEFDITIWDEVGSSWKDSPDSGENFTIHTIADPNTDSDGCTHMINISGIPPECDATNESFTIKIDGDNVIFSNPIPINTTWQTATTVEVGVTITDIGGGIVDGHSIMRRISWNNGTDWNNWIAVPGYSSNLIIEPQDTVFLSEGKDNLIQWKAADSLGNGPATSNEFRMLVDTEYVKFSNPSPLPTDESPTEMVEVKITISDQNSGVNASTIQYTVSTDSGATWSPWTIVPGVENKSHINVTLNLEFPNGTANRIKWRASDIAGNGPKESPVYVVKVNTWLEEIAEPRVTLWSPPNGTIISTNSVELSWRLRNINLFNITYDVYFDTINPPIQLNTSVFSNTSLKLSGLSNKQTYYWTVIPRKDEINGTCESGIWSFTVDIHIPTVTLISPKNGSIIRSLRPRLEWSVSYSGTKQLSYSLYLDTEVNPGLLRENISNANYLPTGNLLDNTKYYWKIVPWAGDYAGPESELWSFTIKKDYIPRFEIDLKLEPSTVELFPGSMKNVTAIVTNSGELTDTISLRIEIPSEANIGAIVNEPSMRDIVSDDSANFSITVTTTEDAKKDEVILRVVAVSEKAVEFDIKLEKDAELTVKILGADEPEPDKSSMLFSLWNLLFIIIIILIIIALAIYIYKRKKKEEEEQEKAAPEAVMVKPGELPTEEITIGSAPKPEQLPKTTEAEKVTPVISPEVPKPQLPGTTPEQGKPEDQQTPKLPPGDTEKNVNEMEETIQGSSEENSTPFIPQESKEELNPPNH